MKNIGIAIVGLGNIGSRLYKEILSKKKDIGLKTNTKINIHRLKIDVIVFNQCVTTPI